MLCPYCKKECISYSHVDELECIQKDHEFWFARPNSWYIHHLPSDIYIDDYHACYNDHTNHGRGYDAFYKTHNINQEDGAKILKQYIKLLAFL